MNIIQILNKDNLDFKDICTLLSLSNSSDIELLRQKAENVLLDYVGNNVSIRGLIEFSNYCVCDCLYCGIRKSNLNVTRFRLSEEEVLSCVDWAIEKNIGSVVLQSGECRDKETIKYITQLIKLIKKRSISTALPNGLGITLSVGEQTFDTYKSFFDAGAHRYLLRIETTNQKLFSEIHPNYQLFSKRLECLESIKKIGFQLGTGVMIGLPNQTIEDLANDLLFFKELDVDMVGMGPFIPHNQTPFAKADIDKKTNFLLGLKMISVLRLLMKDINIASTTALETLSPKGRMLGLMHGANVIMPQLTPVDYKNKYILYDDKPDIDEQKESIFGKLKINLNNINRNISFNQWGDSLHFKNKNRKQ